MTRTVSFSMCIHNARVPQYKLVFIEKLAVKVTGYVLLINIFMRIINLRCIPTNSYISRVYSQPSNNSEKH